jgi:hypothetical protein
MFNLVHGYNFSRFIKENESTRGRALINCANEWDAEFWGF